MGWNTSFLLAEGKTLADMLRAIPDRGRGFPVAGMNHGDESDWACRGVHRRSRADRMTLPVGNPP